MDYLTIGICVGLSVLISWFIIESKFDKSHWYKRNHQRYRASGYLHSLEGFILLIDRRIKYSVNNFLNHYLEEFDQIINLSVEYSHVVEYDSSMPEPGNLIRYYLYIVSQALKAKDDDSISNSTLIIDLLNDEEDNFESYAFSGINYDVISDEKNIIFEQMKSVLAFDDELKDKISKSLLSKLYK